MKNNLTNCRHCVVLLGWPDHPSVEWTADEQCDGAARLLSSCMKKELFFVHNKQCSGQGGGFVSCSPKDIIYKNFVHKKLARLLNS
jgi:hypothetical protein